jgi:hypothetical protein
LVFVLPLILPAVENHAHSLIFSNLVIFSNIGDAAVGVCLNAASKAHQTLQEVTAFLNSLPQVHISAAALAAVDADAAAAAAALAGVGAGGSGSAGLENSQAETSAAAAAHMKRKRPLSGGVTAPPADAHHSNQLGSGSQLLANSAGGSGTSSLATLADSSIEAAAASSKGLKHFSLKVCEKVEGKGFTNYNEVADELVKDMLADAAVADGSAQGGTPGLAVMASGAAIGPHDDKNIRRRVYDALNVLEALGIISKSKRDIQWRGWPPALRKITTEKDKLEAERARIAARIQLKTATTHDVTTKAFCLSNLVLRNRDAPLCVLIAAQELGMMAPNPLALPFMLIHAPEDAEVDIEITPDEKTAHLHFHHHPFSIFDDENVMGMMGLGEPQPELAAAIFGDVNNITTSRDAKGGDGGAVGVGAEGDGVAVVGVNLGVGRGDQLQDHLAGAHTDFADMPEYQQQHQIPLPPPPQPPQQQQQQQQRQQQPKEPVEMSDTPLKNTVFNNGLPGVPMPNAFAVLSPSAAVSAMDLGPDDTPLGRK